MAIFGISFVTFALLCLCVFIFIEGGRRALGLTFKWIDTVEGILLMLAGLLGFIGLLGGGGKL